MSCSAARRALTREQVRPSIPRRRRAPAPRALPPTKPSVPPRPGQSSPDAGAPLPSRRECSSCAPPPAGARAVVAWRRGPLARGQHHGTADSRVPARPGASRRSVPAPPGTAPRRRRGRRVARASTAMGCQQAGKFRPSTRSASRELGRSLGLARVKGWPLLHSLESRVLSPSMVRACGSIIAARVTCVLSYVRYRPVSDSFLGVYFSERHAYGGGSAHVTGKPGTTCCSQFDSNA